MFGSSWRKAVKLFKRVSCLAILPGLMLTTTGRLSSAIDVPSSDNPFALKGGDVVAFVGGSDVVTAQHAGHLEALLVGKHRGSEVRFRNFGWDGDTVFAQPRDVGFPPLQTHLRRARASVIVLQFGRTESLSGLQALPHFVTAYEGLLNDCLRQTPRIVLVIPPPFEDGSGLLPKLTIHNADLAAYAEAIHELAKKRGFWVVDLFAKPATELGGPRLTHDGLQLTPRGHALIARSIARQCGFGEIADRAGEPNPDGTWPNPAFERLREQVVAKNRLWFNYWRPQNWAFLGGDRTNQPSSRDHRDSRIRWFPDEMEEFATLIEAKEREISQLAERLTP
jgi:hypothetical protein